MKVDLFDPQTLIENKYQTTFIEPCGSPELVLLVGPPASGKSTFAQTYFQHYVSINQDTLRTKRKCLVAAKQALLKKKSVIVDNTNASPMIRKEWIELAKECDAAIRAIVLDVSKPCVCHFNIFRSLGYGEKRERLPLVAIHTFFAKYVEPELSEGFKSVIKVPFVLKEFQDGEEKEAFFCSYSSL